MTNSKKAFIVLVIVGAFLLIIGFALVIAGFGGISGLKEEISHQWHGQQAPAGVDSQPSTSFTEDVSEPVRSVIIRIKAADIAFVVSDKPGVDAENFGDGDITVTQGNGVLSIVGSGRHQNGNWNWSSSGDWLSSGIGAREKLTIRLPLASLSSLELQLSSCTVSLEDFTIDNLDIEVGAGDCSLRNVAVGKADIECGAGTFACEGCDFKNASFQCGAGNLSFDGRLSGENSLSSGAGNATMTLDGTASDWFIEAEQGIGIMSIDGVQSAGIADRSFGKRTAPNSLEIESGIGSIKISFKG